MVKYPPAFFESSARKVRSRGSLWKGRASSQRGSLKKDFENADSLDAITGVRIQERSRAWPGKDCPIPF